MPQYIFECNEIEPRKRFHEATFFPRTDCIHMNAYIRGVLANLITTFYRKWNWGNSPILYTKSISLSPFPLARVA